MPHSVFDLFKIGVGPSSSHTMGPMSAACAFTEQLRDRGLLDRTGRVLAELYGSLALTGKGHASDRAVLLGLAGKRPDGICPDEAERIVTGIRASHRTMLGGTREIPFEEARDLLFHQRERLSFHSNGMNALVPPYVCAGFQPAHAPLGAGSFDEMLRFSGLK